MPRGTIVKRHGPEYKIQQDVINFLRVRGWFVKVIHGSTFQTGLPDLYIAKRTYGSRWVEIKNPKAYRFTPAQLEVFPRLSSEGIGIWIITAATEDEYLKLFKPPNWWEYLKIPNMNK
ncbi:MAG: hypothetical protein WC942_04220 [Clostridia bacterium]|jgi:hypothetical protein